MTDVVITTQQMYTLLLEIDRKVTQLGTETATQTERIIDHEDRLREIEDQEDVGRRVTEMEDDIKAIRQELEDLKRRVWAIPSASVIIAAVAVVITIARTF